MTEEQFSDFEKGVVQNILTRNSASWFMVASQVNENISVISARNGIIAFLFDQGWTPDEICAKLKQPTEYVSKVLSHYQEDVRARQLAIALKNSVHK